MKVRAPKAANESEAEWMARLLNCKKKLTHLLEHGRYGPHRKAVDGDLTKLPFAEGMDKTDTIVAKSLIAVTSEQPGCQAVRRQIGHVLDSAKNAYGHALFLTISPNERQSSLVLRLSRYHADDPLLNLGQAPAKR